jgi:hypothetical protein
MRRREVQGGRTFALVLACILFGSHTLLRAQGLPVQTAEPTPAHGHHGSRHAAGSSLDDRVESLRRALDLDPQQQLGVRRALERQRDRLNSLWADSSVPAANRVKATELIGEETADQIRELLNEEQKRLYKPPRPSHDTAPAPSVPAVEALVQSMIRAK